MADQDNGKHDGKSDAQGSNRIQRLTLLASFLAICAPLALGIWVYNFSEHPLSKAQQELSYIQSRLGKIEEQSKEMINNLTIIEKSVSSKLKAIDLLYKMRPHITVKILKIFPHKKESNSYYVDCLLENRGGYSSFYRFDKACIVEEKVFNSFRSSACSAKHQTSINAIFNRGSFILSAGAKSREILTLLLKRELRIGDVIYVEIKTFADKALSKMALKIANGDFNLGLKPNHFEETHSCYLKITSPPNCGENTWCPE